jgi:putative AdoMet-dependent methyltransferase
VSYRGSADRDDRRQPSQPRRRGARWTQRNPRGRRSGDGNARELQRRNGARGMRVSARDREQLFNDWADSYDDETSAPQHPFPHGGYDLVLAEVVKQAVVAPGQSVLDLGIGTAKLAVKLAALGCCIWGLDFSSEMLAQARARLPDAVLVQADLRDEWPPLLERRFDRIVSSYVLHEFDLDAKVVILRRAAAHLVTGGRIVIGDIAFGTVEERAASRSRWYERWDNNEWYWAADEAVVACREAGLHATYTQIARCGGVFTVVQLDEPT